MRKQHPDTIFIDIGASNGVKSLVWARKFPKAKIYAIEPHLSFFNQLDKQSKQYPNMTCFQLAISNKNGKRPFYVSKDPACSSLLPFVRENMKKWRCPPGRSQFQTSEIVEIETKTLKQFLQEQRLKVVDLIKIDAQGHDLEILKSLGNYIQYIKEITCEVQITNFELYKDQSKKQDLLDFMEKNGFSIFKTKRWSYGQEENIWFTNNKYEKRLGNRFWHLGLGIGA